MKSFLDNWTVTQCGQCGEHNYTYGDVEKFKCCNGCESQNYFKVNESTLTLEDILTIIELELSDANYYSMSKLPDLLRIAVEESLDDGNNQKRIFKAIAQACNLKTTYITSQDEEIK